jgi:hypothetical protein
MLDVILALLRSLFSLLQPRSRLALDNLALRHQLAVIHRQASKPKLCVADRLLWVGLSHFWPQWHEAQQVVEAFPFSIPPRHFARPPPSLPGATLRPVSSPRKPEQAHAKAILRIVTHPIEMNTRKHPRLEMELSALTALPRPLAPWKSPAQESTGVLGRLPRPSLSTSPALIELI